MTDFPRYLRPLEIEAILSLARRRAQEVEETEFSDKVKLRMMGQGELVDLAVATLNREALVELTALAWLGRGAEGEDAADWNQLLHDARILYDDPEYVWGCMNARPSEKAPVPLKKRSSF